MFLSKFGIQFKRKFRCASRIRVGCEKSERAKRKQQKKPDWCMARSRNVAEIKSAVEAASPCRISPKSDLWAAITNKSLSV